MEMQIGFIQENIRKTHSEIVKLADLKRRGVINAEICDVFEKAERYWVKRKRKENVLEWWLGWTNHRQLLKVFRETRIENRSQIGEVTAVFTADESDSANAHNLEENCEDSELTAIDSIEEIVFDDDEDFKEELRVAQEKTKVKTTSDEASEKKDSTLHFDKTAVSLEEETLVDFAKNQLNRMEFVRDLLSAIPNNACLEESFDVGQILTMPLRQRWMLFGKWKRVYREMIEMDLRKSKEEYESQIKEYNQLKGQALAALCRTADVVGMTTTGAAKNRLLLESLKAKIGTYFFFFFFYIHSLTFIY
jgi:hypothetical protein